MRRLALLPVLAVLAGCGGDGGPEAAVLRFTADGPAPARVAASAPGGLVVRSEDGRPRVMRLTTPGRPEVVVPPGGEASVDLAGVPPGDYRIVPTGATPPIPLRVR